MGRPRSSSLFSMANTSNTFQADWLLVSSFPLTLTLSPRRGSAERHRGQIQREDSMPILKSVLPLPEGEGWGEGKGSLRISLAWPLDGARNQPKVIRLKVLAQLCLNSFPAKYVAGPRIGRSVAVAEEEQMRPPGPLSRVGSEFAERSKQRNGICRLSASDEASVNPCA